MLNKPLSSHGEYVETWSFQFFYDIARCDPVPNPKMSEGKQTDPLHFPGTKRQQSIRHPSSKKLFTTITESG